MDLSLFPQATPVSKNQLKYFRSLLVKKYRAQEHKFLIEGVRCIEEALAARTKIDALVFDSSLPASERGRNLVQSAISAGVAVLYADERDLKKLTDAVQAQGVVAVLSRTPLPFRSEDFSAPGTLVALNAVSDPGNAGAVVRTSDWFGVRAVLFDRHTVDLYSPKTLRSTAGSVFHLPVYEQVDLEEAIPSLQNEGYVVYSAESSGRRRLNELRFAEKSIVIFGSEAGGVTPEISALCDEQVQIDRYGRAESLNVAVAAGIFLAAITNRH